MLNTRERTASRTEKTTTQEYNVPQISVSFSSFSIFSFFVVVLFFVFCYLFVFFVVVCVWGFLGFFFCFLFFVFCCVFLVVVVVVVVLMLHFLQTIPAEEIASHRDSFVLLAGQCI